MKTIISAVVAAVLNWLVGFVTDAIKKAQKQKETDAEIEKKTKAQAEKLKKSVTDKEDEDAAKEILSRK